jgi:inner membrane protein
MLIFGHTGITLGVAVLLSGALIKSRILPGTKELEEEPQRLQGGSASQNSYLDGIMPWLSSLASRIDIRLLLIGSLLPDIIDKPIGRIFFGDIFSNGRIFCHTLLFLIVLVLGGLYLYWRHKKTWLLALSFGTFTHLILDQMWLEPHTILWPIYGFTFERRASVTLGHWLKEIIYDTLDYPVMCILELAGAVVIAWFVWVLVRRRKLCTFIVNGRV